MDACYTINRKRNYFRVYNLDEDFPLDEVKAYKNRNHVTYQVVANTLMEEGKLDETQYLLNL